MPELDRFEARLTSAVHAFADRAETSVDAVVVAERAVGPRRGGALAWLWRTVPVPISTLLLLGVLAAVAFWSIQVGGPWNRSAPVVPPPAPTATPSPTPSPTPTPDPRPAYVTGTTTITVVTEGTVVEAGGVTKLRGVVATTTDTMDDPRVTGTGTVHRNADSQGGVGPQWGTYRLEVAGGTWEGACTGALWSGGAVSDTACWLVGSGAFEGYTYYYQARGTDILEVIGAIIPGSPPAP
jgi:hypothetical protein